MGHLVDKGQRGIAIMIIKGNNYGEFVTAREEDEAVNVMTRPSDDGHRKWRETGKRRAFYPWNKKLTVAISPLAGFSAPSVPNTIEDQ